MIRPEAVCSANPNLIISELMSHPSKVPAFISDLAIKARSLTKLQKYVKQNSDESDMYYSCLDIRGAHASQLYFQKKLQMF